MLHHRGEVCGVPRCGIFWERMKSPSACAQKRTHSWRRRRGTCAGDYQNLTGRTFDQIRQTVAATGFLVKARYVKAGGVKLRSESGIHGAPIPGVATMRFLMLRSVRAMMSAFPKPASQSAITGIIHPFRPTPAWPR